MYVIPSRRFHDLMPGEAITGVRPVWPWTFAVVIVDTRLWWRGPVYLPVWRAVRGLRPFGGLVVAGNMDRGGL